MIVEKTKNGFEATSTLLGYELSVLDYTIPMELVGYGQTSFEAIKKCLYKIDLVVNPGNYEKCNSCKKVACMCYENSYE